MKYHRLKSGLFTLLDKLPGKLGYDLYHSIQKLMFKNIGPNISANKDSIEKIKEILTKNGQTTNGKDILEIGSGWMPLMPYFFKYDGLCNNVYTYDINEHYDNKYILQLNSYFKAKYGVDFNAGKTAKYLLPDFIKYHPNCNVISAGLPKKVNIIFSRFVLEHVRPEDILAMHRRFSEQFDEDTVVLHLISPSDHRAYSDTSISYYDFLKYSQAEWDKIQTKFDYHNRLRLPQYLRIFKDAGYDAIYIEYDDVEKDSKKYSDFKKLVLHKDYLQFNETEILAGSINVLLKKQSRLNIK